MAGGEKKLGSPIDSEVMRERLRRMGSGCTVVELPPLYQTEEERE